jgi:hypothetical protein
MEFSKKALIILHTFNFYEQDLQKKSNSTIFWREYITSGIVVYELTPRLALILWTPRQVTGRQRKLRNEEFHIGSRQIKNS